MYDPEYTREFYNEYADAEWTRLERNPHGKLKAIIHEDFVRRYVKSDFCVLDAGSGPGRFSITAINSGAKVTVLDISDTQLELAREKISEAGLEDGVEQFIRGDVSDLSVFPDNSFNIVICFGGALSYVCEKRQQAADELVRVTKSGGYILVSVMSLIGAVISVADMPQINTLTHPDEEIDNIPPLWLVFESGDLPAFPSGSRSKMHAPMHLYTDRELRQLFEKCEVLETAGSNVTIKEYGSSADAIYKNPKAWETLVEMEKKLNHDPGLVNSGNHIILTARKPA
ncbi:MAG: class I SAM-dependent methyltransferase [Dehalococcoidales bacterium]|nr:class I SAM-dependent methyltransferase [Dehalococcoidales bacterium]